MNKSLIYYALIACALMSQNKAIADDNAPRRPQFDATHPDVHDPVMAKGEDGHYYIFATGMGVGVMSSDDMKEWKIEPSVFKEAPA